MKKIIGIASLPDREDLLKDAIASLHDQADIIHIGLNLYPCVPNWLKNYPKVKPYLLDNSLGDAAKFYKVEESQGYYFCCDDDLIYSYDYCDFLISKCNQHKCLIGLHGVTMVHPVLSYYKSRSVIHCLHPYLGKDILVDLLGTGCCCFNTSDLKVKLSDFPVPNMADVWLGDVAKKQAVGVVCVERRNGLITYNRAKMQGKKTIYDEYKATNKDEVQTQISSLWSPL